MADTKNSGTDDFVPIGFFPKEAGDPTPFTLDWSDSEEAVKQFAASTNKYADTCFDNMVAAGHILPSKEEVSSTGSSLGGETADTTIVEF